MPNWCYNSAEISHPDPAKIDELIAVAKAGTMFEHFIPLPDGKWDRAWCVDNWGTKWEMSNPSVLERIDPNCLNLNFDTAWSPPIGVFEAMKQAGYYVRCEFSEDGAWFAGCWDNGEDECYDISELPEHLEHLKPSDWNEEEAA